MNNDNITGIILAGGRSTRIGKNKALLKINGKPIIEIISSKLEEKLKTVIIISNKQHDYSFLKLKVFPDIFPGFGPLSGIHAGLYHSKTDLNFIISTDLPLINNDLINFILSQNFGNDIIVPTSGNNYHLLCGLYRKSCLSAAESLLIEAERELTKKKGKSQIKLFDLFQTVNVKYIDISAMDFFNNDVLYNMNTEKDYEYVKKVFDNLG